MFAEDPPHILVVDADPAVRRLLVLLLERQGWRVTTAADGEAALEILRADLPDVLLIDLILPKRSGTEILEWIDTTNRSWLGHVIVLTGASHTVRADLRNVHSICGMIRKPFDIGELVGKIGSCAVRPAITARSMQGS